MHGPQIWYGTVTAFDESLGFGDVMRAEDQRTYFFHCTQIADGSRTIAEGAAVRFSVQPGSMGRWEAVDVERIGPREAGDASASDLGGTTGGFSCPVCGAAVDGDPGAYDICARCGWEDDPVQAADPFYAGGANTLSLADARADWLRRQHH